MTELLPNHFNGTWQTGTGQGTVLTDPVLGTELVRVDATGLDLAAGFAFAREQGGQALRALTYVQRAGLLAAAQKVLQANRDAYYDIATANSGTVKNDSAVDIDGGIFTLGTYAKLGEGASQRRHDEDEHEDADDADRRDDDAWVDHRAAHFAHELFRTFHLECDDRQCVSQASGLLPRFRHCDEEF